jgi:hypothetical protein
MQKSDALMLATARIMGLSEKSIGNITGGDSFIFFRFLASNDPEITRVWEIHHGNYPLSGVTARITDIDLSRQAIATHGPDKSDVAFISVMPMPPNYSGTGSIKYELGGTDHHDFNIFFSGRNGDWIENLRLRKVNNSWISAVRVIQQQPGKKPHYFYDIENEYPQQLKDIDWDH